MFFYGFLFRIFPFREYHRFFSEANVFWSFGIFASRSVIGSSEHFPSFFYSKELKFFIVSGKISNGFNFFSENLVCSSEYFALSCKFFSTQSGWKNLFPQKQNPLVSLFSLLWSFYPEKYRFEKNDFSFFPIFSENLVILYVFSPLYSFHSDNKSVCNSVGPSIFCDDLEKFHAQKNIPESS